MPPPLSARGRGNSMHFGQPGAQPFSFLLQLPSANGLPVSGGSHVAPPGLVSPSPSSVASYSSGLASPNASKRTSFTGGAASASGHARRASVLTGAGTKKGAVGLGEFLERSLAALSSEELLLLSNKANLHLFARLQQQQAATAAAGAGSIPAPSSAYHLSPPAPVAGLEHTSGVPLRSATVMLSPSSSGGRTRALS